MSMASNHLSELANKGRYGDTEVRIIDNDYAHVNKPESIVIDEYGDKGINWVKQSGSNTINPETGKKEHFWPAVMGIAAAAGVLNQGIGMYRSGKQQEQSGLAQVQMLGETEKEMQKLIQNLPALRESQEEVALGGFEMQSQRLGEGFTKAMDTLETQAGRTDLVTSAGVRQKEIEAVDALQTSMEGQEIGLRKTYADIGADYEKMLGDYQNKLKQVRLQKDLAQEQADSWYLGKNFGFGKGKKGFGLLGLFS
jgi:hypothetical protein|tara:strand:+ start:213 stop:971 length:759 start_codon:yes stop_codon:yes gene_type:complete